MSQRSTALSRPAALTLWVGAAVWLTLLIVGLLVPAGWKWDLPGLYGHINRFMISLWAVGLVAAPLLAWRAGTGGRAAAQVYLLANLAVILSSVQGPLDPRNEGVPIAVALLNLLCLLRFHPERLGLLRP
jgi:hypothetical protein